MEYAIVVSKKKIWNAFFNRSNLEDGITIKNGTINQKVIETFQSQTEALSVLKKHLSFVKKGTKYTKITEYYVATKCDDGFYEPYEFAMWDNPEYEQIYAESADMTFIMEMRGVPGETIQTVVGFYYGKPEEEVPAKFIGKVSAIF